jgi:carboxyl-terminal processing protease
MEMVECSLVATLAPRPLPGQVRKALPRPAAFGARARLRVRSVGREEPLHPQQTAVRASGPDHGGRALGQAAVGFAAAAVVSLTGFSGDVSPLPTPPARAESLTVAFPVSKAREVS